MSKIFKLREWLTIEEACSYLSKTLNEEILEKDIYRFALDGHIKLSIDLVNKAYAILGTIEPIENIEYIELPNGHPFATDAVSITRGFVIVDDFNCIRLGEKISSIGGIWDIPMWGNEKIDMLYKYQQLIDGPEVELLSIDGTFITKDKKVAQLQEDFEDNEFQKGSKAYKVAVEEYMEEVSATDEERKYFYKNYKKDRQEYLDKRHSQERELNYYPAGGLPHDTNIVVKTSEINKLLNKLACNPNENGTINTKEKYSFLLLINALCKKNNIIPTERGAAGKIARLAEQYGTPITEDTVLKILKQIPEAVESRQK